MPRPVHQCPYCARGVRTHDNGRYTVHLCEPDQRCPMSNQRVPITGLTDGDHERRAHTVLDLAQQVQDEDPAVVWTYLTATPADELQRLLMFALAAIPVDRSVNDIYAWVCELPVARRAS